MFYFYIEFQYFVRNFSIVADHVKEACGNQLFEMFLVNFILRFQFFILKFLSQYCYLYRLIQTVCTPRWHRSKLTCVDQIKSTCHIDRPLVNRHYYLMYNLYSNYFVSLFFELIFLIKQKNHLNYNIFN